MDRGHVLVWLDRLGGCLSTDTTYWYRLIVVEGPLWTETTYWFGWTDLGVVYPLRPLIDLA